MLALADAKGGCTTGWIKKPEANSKSYSYRYRPEAGGRTRRVRCEFLVKEVFDVEINCDNDWYESICMICEANRKKKLTPQEMGIKIMIQAERTEEMAIAEHAIKKYPKVAGDQPDFWRGF